MRAVTAAVHRGAGLGPAPLGALYGHLSGRMGLFMPERTARRRSGASPNWHWDAPRMRVPTAGTLARHISQDIYTRPKIPAYMLGRSGRSLHLQPAAATRR